MATFNGAKYLVDQIQSIINQSYKNIHLLISDDGSTDSTNEILLAFKRKYPNQIQIVKGPQNGLENNFYGMLMATSGYDLYAFSDQDDVWLSDKIERSVAAFKYYSNGAPFVYCSSTMLVDSASKIIGQLKNDQHGIANFRQALGYNIATGNTILFNEAARRLVPNELLDTDYLGHDWLILLYVLSVGGVVFYDNKPTVKYRIHEANYSSIKNGYYERSILLYKWIVGGELRKTNSQILASLNLISSSITLENIRLLEDFIIMHNAPLIHRVRAYFRNPIHRRKKISCIVNLIAVLTGNF